MHYDRFMDRLIRGVARESAAAGVLLLLLVLVAFLGTFLLQSNPAFAAGNRPSEAAAAGLSSTVVGSRLESAPEEALGAWTESELREAEPAKPPVRPGEAFDLPDFGDASTSLADGEFLPSDIDQAPLRAHGKVFFRVGEDNYVCSGTVVNSRGRNVVLTAGHCVYNIDRSQYVDELIFIPAYDGNAPESEPFGRWAAAAVFTSRQYAEQGRLTHDIGAVVMQERIQDTVGSRRIAFDLDPTRRPFTIYGYPAAPSPPYDGKIMIGCRSQVTGRDWLGGKPFPIAAEPCDMAGGSSGGGWITSSGYLNSVVSYGYCEPEVSQDFCGTTFGPFFTDQAKAIYTYPAVGGSARPTVKISQGPRGRIGGSRAKFRFEGFGSTPVSFRCRLDRGAYSRCANTTTFKRLRRGPHVLRVYAVDQTGRSSASPATRRFRADG
jgi:hypothetical protein